MEFLLVEIRVGIRPGVDGDHHEALDGSGIQLADAVLGKPDPEQGRQRRARADIVGEPAVEKVDELLLTVAQPFGAHGLEEVRRADIALCRAAQGDGDDVGRRWHRAAGLRPVLQSHRRQQNWEGGGRCHRRCQGQRTQIRTEVVEPLGREVEHVPRAHIRGVQDHQGRVGARIEVLEGRLVEQLLTIEIFAEYVDARVAGPGKADPGDRVGGLAEKRRHVVLRQEVRVQRLEAVVGPLQPEPGGRDAAAGRRRNHADVVDEPSRPTVSLVGRVLQELQHVIGERRRPHPAARERHHDIGVVRRGVGGPVARPQIVVAGVRAQRLVGKVTCARAQQGSREKRSEKPEHGPSALTRRRRWPGDVRTCSPG